MTTVREVLYRAPGKKVVVLLSCGHRTVLDRDHTALPDPCYEGACSRVRPRPVELECPKCQHADYLNDQVDKKAARDRKGN